jgi:hypothetical protein
LCDRRPEVGRRGEHGCTDARRHLDRDRFDDDRSAERSTHSIRVGGHSIRVDGVEDDGELVATETSDETIASGHGSETRTDSSKYEVADCVAVSVVHGLEPVEVHEEQGRAASRLTPVCSEEVRDMSLQTQPVRESGQMIVMCSFVEAAFRSGTDRDHCGQFCTSNDSFDHPASGIVVHLGEGDDSVAIRRRLAIEIGHIDVPSVVVAPCAEA